MINPLENARFEDLHEGDLISSPQGEFSVVSATHRGVHACLGAVRIGVIPQEGTWSKVIFLGWKEDVGVVDENRTGQQFLGMEADTKVIRGAGRKGNMFDGSFIGAARHAEVW